MEIIYNHLILITLAPIAALPEYLTPGRRPIVPAGENTSGLVGRIIFLGS